MENQACKRPRNGISSYVFYKHANAQGEFLPLTYKLMDWIIMQASCKGPHKVPKSKRGSILHQWKGRILNFKIDKDGKRLAQVQHVYMAKDMYLDPASCPRRIAPHYVFPSNFVDWEPLESFIGTFTAFHEDIGNLLCNGETSSTLVHRSIYWYNAKYIVPRKKGGFGRLETIVPPQLRHVDSQMPDSQTVQSFKGKILKDILAAMKFTFGSKWCRPSWFVPFHVFVHCFRNVHMRRTKTSWSTTSVDESTLENFLGEKWSVKEGVQKGEEYECRVCKDNVLVRYHIARQTLYIAFHYGRWKRTHGCFLPLDSNDAHPDVDIGINEDGGEHVHNITVNATWTLRNVREHLLVMDDVSENFIFKLNDRRICKRLERTIQFVEFGPPAVLRLFNIV